MSINAAVLELVDVMGGQKGTLLMDFTKTPRESGALVECKTLCCKQE